MAEFFRFLVLNYKKIAIVTISGGIILFLWFWIAAPLTYISPASVLPPDNNKSGSFSSLLQGADLSMLFSGGGSSVNSQLYAQILKSRTISEEVVEKLNLKEYFDSETVGRAAEKLEKQLYVDVTKEGILKLHVEIRTGFFARFTSERDSIKKLAYLLTTAFLDGLDKINQEKLSSKAGKVRRYLEMQLVITKATLDSTEIALMNFQRSNKTLSIPDQVRATLEALAKLKAEIIGEEMKLALLEENLVSGSPAVVALKAKLSGLKSQYEKMESGSSDIFVSFASAPELAYKLTNLMRESKILNEVYILLQQQYYKELVQENRDIPTLDVLDLPKIPEREIGPRVIVNTVMGTFFIFIASILIFYLPTLPVKDYLRKFS